MTEEFREFEKEDIDFSDEHEVEVYSVGLQVGKQEAKKEFLEKEIKYLRSPIKEGSKNWVKEHIKELKAELEK